MTRVYHTTSLTWAKSKRLSTESFCCSIVSCDLKIQHGQKYECVCRHTIGAGFELFMRLLQLLQVLHANLRTVRCCPTAPSAAVRITCPLTRSANSAICSCAWTALSPASACKPCPVRLCCKSYRQFIFRTKRPHLLQGATLPG